MICSKCRQRNAEETSVIMKKSSYCKLNVIVKKNIWTGPFLSIKGKKMSEKQKAVFKIHKSQAASISVCCSANKVTP